MGTLTSCSLTPVDFKFLSIPRCGTPRERFRFPELTSSRNSCFLCGERSYRLRSKVLYRNFGRFRCFSVENDRNGDEESGTDASRDSNATATTTAEPEEAAEEFNSEKTTPPASVSSRVLFLRFNFNFV